MDSEDLTNRLLAEYSQTIDPSTALAILSDFDLNNETQVAEARQILDVLKESVPAEEESGFDPSAAAGYTKENPFPGHRSESASTRSALGWTTSTDSTSISQETSDQEGLYLDAPVPRSSSSGEGTPTTAPSQFDSLDEVGKETALLAIFPALKPFDIKWTLKKCKWDAGLAIEELMTQSFLEETGTRHKGIEAFSEETPSKPRRAKKNKRKNQAKDETVQSPQEDTPLNSKWEAARKDVEFLSTKTGMPSSQISSLYHENGGSVRETISALIKAQVDMDMDYDPVIQITAYELRGEYPSILLTDLEALIYIAQPSFNDAKELANALSVRRPSGKRGGIQLELRHAPPALDELSTLPSKTIPTSKSLPSPQLDFHTAANNAQNLRLARETAQTQASSAYRKARSDPLMGAAAGYYSQVSRDLADRARGMDSIAADALVERQSSRTQLDLHGVNVKDAVRISRERVTAWWHELGEQKASSGGYSAIGGFKIVTGLGKHSEGGKGKLGPAVGKMLIREGWKVEVGSGAIVVRGVARR